MATATNAPKTPAEAEYRFFARFGADGCGDLRAVEDRLGRAIARPSTVEQWIALGHELSSCLGGATAVAPPEGPRTLSQVAKELTRPFEVWQVEVKPGAITKDKTRALALAYADLRAYQDRLDEVVGLEGWSVEYRQIGNSAMVCRLTIMGHTREDVGEPSEDGSNPATEALAQAFKRACSAFGLGRYLYSLPRLWFDYDEQAKRFKDEQRIVHELYTKAGLFGPPAGLLGSPARRSGGGR